MLGSNDRPRTLATCRQQAVTPLIELATALALIAGVATVLVFLLGYAVGEYMGERRIKR